MVVELVVVVVVGLVVVVVPGDMSFRVVLLGLRLGAWVAVGLRLETWVTLLVVVDVLADMLIFIACTTALAASDACAGLRVVPGAGKINGGGGRSCRSSKPS